MEPWTWYWATSPKLGPATAAGVRIVSYGLLKDREFVYPCVSTLMGAARQARPWGQRCALIHTCVHAGGHSAHFRLAQAFLGHQARSERSYRQGPCMQHIARPKGGPSMPIGALSHCEGKPTDCWGRP